MMGLMKQHEDVAQVGYWGGHLSEDGRGFGGSNGFDIDYVPGWCFCIKRETYNEHKLFSDKLKFAYCEDSDFSLRLKEAGKRIYALHTPLVHHYQNKTVVAVEKEGSLDLRATFEYNHKYIKERWKYYLANERIMLKRKVENEKLTVLV
jgi:GT2 family glycosyltransferase